jgi:dTDP-L-rhamnose 4-epimerase
MRPAEQLAQAIWDIEPPAGCIGPLRLLPSGETIANPQNPYGLSKIAEEKIAMQMGRRYGIPSVALRYSIVQGPRQSFYNAYSGACRIFSLRFQQGLEPAIYEDGNQVRDYVNIEDVVAANLLVLEDSRADYQVFNVGGEKAITVSVLAKVVAQAFGRDGYEPRPCGKYRFGDTRHIVSDIDKLKSLGWKPVRSVCESVESYRDWLRRSDSIAEILRHAEDEMLKLGVVRTAKS